MSIEKQGTRQAETPTELPQSASEARSCAADLISIVIPCHNEEKSISAFYEEFMVAKSIINEKHRDTQFELLFVDDGSTDSTKQAVQSLMPHESSSLKIEYYELSRNFGKEAAIYAGLEHTKGDYVAVMDADLQDPPSLLPEMYETLLTEDFDNVTAMRTTRDNESRFRKFCVRIFYRLIREMSRLDIKDGARDYRLMKRVMVDAVLAVGENNRFSKGIFSWVGFKTKWLPYKNVERIAGNTKWSFWSLFRYSITGIVSFSATPLLLASGIGIVLCIFAIAYAAFIAIRTFLFGDPVAGWPSTICIITFIGGLQMLWLGILGQYLANTYVETKRRPLYILRSVGFDNDKPTRPKVESGSED